jgi:hypothetical protein
MIPPIFDIPEPPDPPEDGASPVVVELIIEEDMPGSLEEALAIPTEDPQVD